MAQENFSSIYWLGGFHTGGRVRGVNWLRGQWSGGSWEKGNFYSVDLTVDWSGAYRNAWSVWSGGTWRSNSQDYGFTSWSLENEWSIWHGGTWQSTPFPSQTYTWQGPFTNAVNIYGDLTTYECDIPTGNTLSKRSIYLPSPRSLWLGGQWLRGDFKGGIFACGAWHSLKWDPAQYEYLDNLFFMFGVAGNPPWNLTTVTIDGNTYQFITNDNENQPFTIFMFNDAEFFDIDLTVQYDESVSNFYQGAFVNSIWEGGTVIDSNTDPFNTMFGMAIDSETSKIQDDSGFFSKLGFLESNQLLIRQRHGLNLIDYNQYYDNSILNNLNQILFINNGTSYYMPNKFDTGGIYSAIWKRGKFQNGTFMYGQWYDYDDKNNFRATYDTDLNIQNTYNALQPNTTLPVNYSVFEQGLFYSSIWFNGIWLAKNNLTTNKTSSFSRSQWMTGYWAAFDNNATTFSNDRKLTNSKFWKSIWYSGIWDGGEMALSVWNSMNPFNFDISIQGNIVPAIGNNSVVWANIEENPMGLTNGIAYFDSNNLPTTQYLGYINDLTKVDLINFQPVEGFDYSHLVINNLDIYFQYDGTSGAFDPGPYDIDLDLDPSTSGINNLYLYNANEFFINDITVNNAFVRYAGLVDNFASFWKNGTANGMVWNGGIWMTGVFKAYTFDDYPTYITDRRNSNITVQLDWFDENVISQSTVQKAQHGIWQRGLWLAGYFRGDCYQLGMSAFVRNSLLGLTLNFENKFLISDDLLSGQYNNPSAEIFEMRPNNFTSLFCRKTLRETDVPYFSVFNGQMLSGIFYDVNKNGTTTPAFGTLAFSEDITLVDSGATFGRVTYDITINPDAFGNPNPINPDNNNLSFRVKNTKNTIGVDLNIGQPLAYDDINVTLNYNLTTQQYINLFYFNSLQTIVAATGVNSNYNIRHAALTGNMPKWTDILPITEASTRVPSTAQGSGDVEPYYNSLPVIWIDSGYGQ